MGGGPREGPPDWATPVNKTYYIFEPTPKHFIITVELKRGTWPKEDLVLLSLLGVLKLEPLRLNHDRHEEYRRRGKHHPGRRLGKAEKKL